MTAAGPGSVARPRGGRNRPPDEDDAFIRAINRAWAWAAQNTVTVVVIAFVAAVAVGGFFWYRGYQQNLEERAATRLQTLRAQVATGDTAVIGALETYLSRFGGTSSARQARILLARQQLLRGRPSEATSTVRPAIGGTALGSPTGYASRSLLAEAQTAAGDTAGALTTLRELAEGARFGFQRREAAARRADLLAARGRLQEAVAIYRRIAEEAEGQEADDYRLRLGELRARLAAAEDGSAGEDAGEAGGQG